MAETIRLQGRISEAEARGHPYVYLPFRVPPRARRIEVAYAYSEPVTAAFGMGPGNSIDIGIFDSRGHDFIQAPGFRGWSGTSRPQFFIAPNEATPGYIRGPLFPGEWNVILGVARIEPAGAAYDVTVSVDVAAEGEAPPESPPMRGAATAVAPLAAAADSAQPGRWLRGDLHCHTVHSDGLNTVKEIVNNAVALGLDFLAVTDHNTNTHHEDLDALSHLPIVLIPGEEITTYWGHANTWGLREWIEYRCADEESIRAVQRYVQGRGALISINHAKCIGPPWLFDAWEGYPAMEVWQAPWRFYNWESLERWDGLLRRGDRVVAVGGSDVHSIPPAEPRHPHGLAEPTTYVHVRGQPSEASVLDGIRAGHVFVTDSPNGAHLVLTADSTFDGRFEAMMGDTIASPGGRPVRFRVQVSGGFERRLWVIANGCPLDIIPLDRDETTVEFTLDPSRYSYVRAELRGRRGRPERGEVVWAMTNPIWLTAGPA